MVQPVSLGKVEIGSGMPKVAVSIVGRSREEIVTKAQTLRELAVDVVEWRADYYAQAKELPCLLQTLAQVQTVLEDTPLLFTFRSQREGGEQAISPDEYRELNRAAASTAAVSAVDVEMFSEEAAELVRELHQAGKVVVGSYHNFRSTPPREELRSRLLQMREMGADILKIAVTPHSRADVLRLLAVTAELSESGVEQPLVTMSTTGLGVVSRVCGELFGSAMSFGAVGACSAAGQLPVEQLREVLHILHNNMKG
jgi:3-dehydroquinate dehydratase I